jgi:uncharacterized protein (DUF305 family)
MNTLVPERAWPVAIALVFCLTAAVSVRAQGDDTPALYTDQDMMFLVNMIAHHQQAVAMAALVPGRDVPEEFTGFTEQVGRGQAAEIRMMNALLDLAESRGLTTPMRHMDHAHHQMDGMLTPEQMQALAAAEGEEFLRLWLEGMIYHHKGAITMANAQQVHQLDTGRRPYGMDVLVEEIIVVQRAEISMMEQWLNEWGLR